MNTFFMLINESMCKLKAGLNGILLFFATNRFVADIPLSTGELRPNLECEKQTTLSIRLSRQT